VVDAWFAQAIHLAHRLLGIAHVQDERDDDGRTVLVWHPSRRWDLYIYPDSITLRRVPAWNHAYVDDDEAWFLRSFEAIGCAMAYNGEAVEPSNQPPIEFVDTPRGERFRDALQLAAVLHGDDCRKGTSIPYVSHLLAVASLVIENGGSEDLAIAALLHDALEDHPEQITVDDLRARFGSIVTDIVVACSDVVERSADGAKPPWRVRKERYIEHLRHAPPNVLLVALADKVHNARSMVRDLRAADDPRAFWRRFNSTKREQFWYYGSLAKVFTKRLPGPLADELVSLVAELRAEDARRRPARR
jgi:hypothetical protein